ncbi:hypothetical protein DTL21_24930 [Bremerella cremea]|uniref:ABC-type transport auxiliary lipoprotein component domain-containing protein n=1 Tax=Blastopirellula marina TaxID=124 RepID=A0A2S8FB06_9BACT|nr:MULTISPECIES: LPS assembly lipoprotein LptE [Pirellulaceae]PQO29322.1 hypothetical protein C5Y83_24885 [Blastopirellula marina]RCS42626.1 hypothetical protein DTL21_24930 [Bremerella cremea]
MSDQQVNRRFFLFAAASCVAASMTGCVHYQFGNRNLYRPDIHTVHVPIFKSESFRRDLGERLTESIIREIQDTTPYRIADAQMADSVLRGTIVRDDKFVQGTNPLDDPRILREDLQIQYEWIDQRGQLIRQPATLSLASVLRTDTLTAQGVLYPEAGQSMVTAQQEAIDAFAKQVVQNMQAPW